MTRINFIYELEQLNKHFIVLGRLLEQSFDMTVKAADLLDKDVAREVIEKEGWNGLSAAKSVSNVHL